MNEYYGVDMMKKAIEDQDKRLEEEVKKEAKEKQEKEIAAQKDREVEERMRGGAILSEWTNEPSKEREDVVKELERNKTLAKSDDLKRRIQEKKNYAQGEENSGDKAKEKRTKPVTMRKVAERV